MKAFKDMTPMQRIDAMRKSGVTLFPNLSKKEKRAALYIENEPSIPCRRVNHDHR